MILEKETPFWRNEDGKIKISHSMLIEFLNQNGDRKLKVSNGKFILVKQEGKFIKETNEGEIIDFIISFIKKIKDYGLLEVFIKGIGNYISIKKLGLLNAIELVDDKDLKDASRFYFRNTIVEVYQDRVDLIGYDKLEKTIWWDRLLNGNFEKVDDISVGQFYNFCWNISGKENERFNSLCSILGYLLHRNRERGEQVAITFYDENMGNGTAEGRTGKTLLSQALSQVREVIKINGKEYKSNANFKNQRIGLSTDVVVYDDLNKNVSFEDFYSQVTTGIEVEQKRKDSYYIDFKNTPKWMITSNYYIKGPGGSSDRGRRIEFYLANHYSDVYTPEQEFGNRFFDDSWSAEEWNLFYGFLIHCIQIYLQNGLIRYEFKNQLSLISRTSKEFVDFAERHFKTNKTYDKREIENQFNTENEGMSAISAHKFSKWCETWSNEKGLTMKKESSGGIYYLKFEKKVGKVVNDYEFKEEREDDRERKQQCGV